MAFFPIVIRKVGRYVAMHERKEEGAQHLRPAGSKRFWGGDVHCSMTIRPLAFERQTVVRTDA